MKINFKNKILTKEGVYDNWGRKRRSLYRFDYYWLNKENVEKNFNEIKLPSNKTKYLIKNQLYISTNYHGWSNKPGERLEYINAIGRSTVDSYIKTGEYTSDVYVNKIVGEENYNRQYFKRFNVGEGGGSSWSWSPNQSCYTGNSKTIYSYYFREQIDAVNNINSNNWPTTKKDVNIFLVSDKGVNE